MAKRNALGRGLGALLSDDAKNVNHRPVTSLSIGSVNKVPIDQIEPNPHQPRKNFDPEALAELSASIKVHGIIQPLTVRKITENEFQLISGERRLRASKMAKLTEVPVYILEIDNQSMIEMSLIENIQRENLNSIEIAIGYKRLMDECGLKQEKLGERVGKNRSTVNNYLRLLKLPPEIQIGIRDNKIQMGHARALINIDEIDQKLAIYKTTIENDLSVRKVEELVRNLNSNKNNKASKSSKPEKKPSIHIQKVQNDLMDKFETKILIKSKPKGKGEIIIPFYSSDDLNRILEIIDL